MSDNHEIPLRVLVAEADHVVARDIELTLSQSGFAVVGTASTRVETMDLVEDEAPDLILLSVDLESEKDGIELAGELKEQFAIPTVFVTGREEDSVFELARSVRPVGYVRKPFSGAELIACLEAASQRIEPDRELEGQIPWIRSVAEPLGDSVIVSGIDGRVVLMNPSAEELTGWAEEEASGNLYSKVAPTSHVLRENGGGRANGGGAECLITDRNGRQHAVRAITTPVRDENTALLGTITILKGKDADEMEAEPGMRGADDEIGLGSDFDSIDDDVRIPGRRRAIHAMEDIVKKNPDLGATEKETDAKTEEGSSYADLIDQIGDPFLVMDRDLTVVQANVEALNAFGESGSFLGRSFWNLFSEEEIERFEPEFLTPFKTGKKHAFEFNDGERDRWYQVTLYRSDKGVLGLFRDVTDSRATKTEEIRQHRLEGLGLLARGFAHDFNNHLTTVTGNLGLAKELEDDPELIEMLGEAEVATSRAAGLVQQLMTFATGGRPVRESVKIPDLLRQVLADHRMGRPSIRYQFQCGKNRLRANVDRAQIRRVVENLINNAEEAMPDGGTLTVACDAIGRSRVLEIHPAFSPSEDEYLLIEVMDSGLGMDEETAAKAADPYFSTRIGDNATGIGLTVCESIAKAHDGFLSLSSVPGKGTAVVFCVPMANQLRNRGWEEVTSPAVSEQPVSVVGGFGQLHRPDHTILILEDDGPIRRLMGATLRREGYRVIETAEGNSTISEYRRAQESREKISLVIADLTIEQGMGGLETMRRLKEMDSDVVAIVSSGYSDAAAMSNPTAFGFRDVMPKPYSPHLLKEMVDRIIIETSG